MRGIMNIHAKLIRAMIRGDEVAFQQAVERGEYHAGPFKTWKQLWFDLQQIEKEECNALTRDNSLGATI